MVEADTRIQRESAKTKVIFIAGTGRCGSTLLHNLLAQLPDTFAAGELRWLWDLGIQQNRLCSCGRPVRECAIWSDILRAAYGRDPLDDVAARCIDLRGRVHDRHLLPGLLSGGRPIVVDRFEAYAEELAKLLRAIVETQRCRLIVDSSKFANHAQTLACVPDIDLRIIHLVRDPRAVSHSWATPKRDKNEKNGLMRRKSVHKSSLEWLKFHYLIEQTFSRQDKSYLRLRYEDFVADPTSSLGLIADFIGEEAAQSLVHDGTTAMFKVNHAVSGNPIRFEQGRIKIAPDLRWRDDMKPRDKAACTLLTFPLALRYGYLSG